MSDDINDHHKRRGELSVIKMASVRALKEYTKDSEWDLRQQIFQEIFSTDLIQDPNARMKVNQQLIEKYKAVVEERYANSEDQELYRLLLETIPSFKGIRDWQRLKGWEDAVWKQIRDTQLFTKERRAQMMNALFMRGIDKDTQAAKIWLTLSGDYSEKMDIKTDETVDKYREINQILHGKKTNGT